MIVLGIETSCDETSISIIDGKKILSAPVLSQDDVHSLYGGVVPELASRRHMETISPLLKKALNESGVSRDDVEGIAVTHAPGLLGSLLVGLQFAKGLALAWNKPLIGVNHLEGHLNAIQLTQDVPYPHIGLVVSGGHTSMYSVKGFGNYRRLGRTVDDAAGEAFDKVAKLLGLGYPGGPKISKAARSGDSNAFKFKPPIVKGKDLCFSFSGIKTAVMHIVSKQKELSDAFKADLAASFENAAAKFIIGPTIEAAKRNGIINVVLGGGVAANAVLRRMMEEKVKSIGGKFFIPPMDLCTDNAAMIAYVGMKRLNSGESSPLSLNAVANMDIG